MRTDQIVILLGSAPNAVQIRDWQRPAGCVIVAINNAWRLRDDWDVHIAPDDFPADRLPPHPGADQRRLGSADYVPANNDYGGVAYAGGTMAFSAGYWVLAALRPSAMIIVGCDMIYPATGQTHFYGTGTPDPLRVDPTLRNLEAKSARLMLHAARQGCACLRAPDGDSRLVCPAIALSALSEALPAPINVDAPAFEDAKRREAEAGYVVRSGRYWTEAASFKAEVVDAIDQAWLHALRASGAAP